MYNESERIRMSSLGGAERAGRSGLPWGGVASIVGGVLWVSVWLLYLATHGTGMADQHGRLLGLTHHDFGKFLVPSLLLVTVGLFHLRRQLPEKSGLATRAGFAVAMIALAVMTVGAAVIYWSVPWGSYNLDFQQPIIVYPSIIIFFFSTPILALGLILFASGLARARTWPSFVTAAVIVGPLTIIPFLHGTLFGGGFGLSWVIIGYGICRGR